MQYAMHLVVRKGNGEGERWVGVHLGAAMHLWVVLVLAPIWHQHGGWKQYVWLNLQNVQSSGNPAIQYELTWVYNWKCQVETICVDDETAVSPLSKKHDFRLILTGMSGQTHCLLNIHSPWQYYHFQYTKWNPIICR